jgi:hypothetical protein
MIYVQCVATGNDGKSLCWDLYWKNSQGQWIDIAATYPAIAKSFPSAYIYTPNAAPVFLRDTSTGAVNPLPDHLFQCGATGLGLGYINPPDYDSPSITYSLYASFYPMFDINPTSRGRYLLYDNIVDTYNIYAGKTESVHMFSFWDVTDDKLSLAKPGVDFTSAHHLYCNKYYLTSDGKGYTSATRFFGAGLVSDEPNSKLIVAYGAAFIVGADTSGQPLSTSTLNFAVVFVEYTLKDLYQTYPTTIKSFNLAAFATYGTTAASRYSLVGSDQSNVYDWYNLWAKLFSTTKLLSVGDDNNCYVYLPIASCGEGICGSSNSATYRLYSIPTVVAAGSTRTITDLGMIVGNWPTLDATVMEALVLGSPKMIYLLMNTGEIYYARIPTTPSSGIIPATLLSGLVSGSMTTSIYHGAKNQFYYAYPGAQLLFDTTKADFFPARRLDEDQPAAVVAAPEARAAARAAARASAARTATIAAARVAARAVE